VRTALWLGGGLGLLALLFAGLTLAALELQEVVVIRTRANDGSTRETRIWIAEEADFWMLEAASPESPWYGDILESPRVEIVRGDRVIPARLTPAPGPEGHLKIRELLRRKYGLADVWIGLIQDGSQSILVRAEPLGASDETR